MTFFERSGRETEFNLPQKRRRLLYCSAVCETGGGGAGQLMIDRGDNKFAYPARLATILIPRFFSASNGFLRPP